MNSNGAIGSVGKEKQGNGAGKSNNRLYRHPVGSRQRNHAPRHPGCRVPRIDREGAWD